MEYPRRINSSKDELYRMKKMNSQKTVLLICDEIYKICNYAEKYVFLYGDSE